MAKPLKATEIRHVIRSHNPWQRWVVVSIVVTLVMVGGWALYAWGRSEAEYDWARAGTLEAEQRRLVAEIRRLRGENQRLSQRVVLLERGGQIDKKAAGVLNQTLRDEQAKLTALKEQVEFYRGIVSPEGYSASVRVYELQVRPGGEAGLYHYDLVLIQPVRHDSMVSGNVEVTISGLQAGQARTYRLTELEVEQGKSLLFSFKYFQELSGTIRLPAGFRPSRIQVEVQRSGAATGRSQQAYDWQAIEKPAGA